MSDTVDNNLQGTLTLHVKDYHAQEQSGTSSEKVKIGPVEWMAKLTVYKQTHIKTDGRPVYWYNYSLRVLCLLPDDTKFYNCHASIQHGWFTDVRIGGTTPRTLPTEPTFHETLKFRFTHKSPVYRHGFTFDRGLSYDESFSKMVTFLKINLEHDTPPVRAICPNFTDNTVQWHDLKVLCGPEEKELYTNKSLLALMSPVFRALLYGEFREGGGNHIVLPDTSFEEFSELLQHIYPNVRKPVTESNVGLLLRLADRYLMDSVTVECETYLIFYDSSRPIHHGVSPLTWEEREEFANLYRLKILKMECERELARSIGDSCSIK